MAIHRRDVRTSSTAKLIADIARTGEKVEYFDTIEEKIIVQNIKKRLLGKVRCRADREGLGSNKLFAAMASGNNTQKAK